MFKMLKGGLRRSNATTQPGAGRILGWNKIRSGQAPAPRKPAFVPDTPQDQVRDIKSSRVGGLE